MDKDYVKMIEEWLRPIWEWDAKEDQCQDKKSTHYLMCHMTQEEWAEMCKGKTMQKHTYNMIKRSKS